MSNQMNQCFGERWQIHNFKAFCQEKKKIRRSVDEMLFLKDGVVEISMSLKPSLVIDMFPETLGLDIDVGIKFCGIPVNKNAIKVDFFLLSADGYRDSIDSMGAGEQHVDGCYLTTTYECYKRNLLTDSSLTPDDTLTIVPRFSVHSYASDLTTDIVQVPISKTTFVDTNPANLLEKLLHNDKYTDFVFSVQEVEFKAHKAIVAARSSVFEAMIERDSKGKKENRAVITDVGPNLFEEMLRYVYTGKVKNVSNVAPALLRVADKYDLKGLKDICEDELSKGLCPNNAVKLLTQADMWSCERLKAQTIEYICRNMALVRNTDAWKDLASNASAKLISQVYDGLLEGKPLRCIQIPSKKRKHVTSENGRESDTDDGDSTC